MRLMVVQMDQASIQLFSQEQSGDAISVCFHGLGSPASSGKTRGNYSRELRACDQISAGTMPARHYVRARLFICGDAPILFCVTDTTKL